MQNDYYIGKNFQNTNSLYKTLKEIDKKYSNKSDKNSVKIIRLNNLAFDKFHDLLSLKENNKYFLNGEDFLFLLNNNSDYAHKLLHIDTQKPTIENFQILQNELFTRKDAIRAVKNDLKQRKIEAKIELDDIQFQNITQEFLGENDRPEYVKEFLKATNEIGTKNADLFNENIAKNCTMADVKLRANCYVEETRKKDILFYDKIAQIDGTWKNRYTVLAVEKKKDGNKIFHLYEVYPFKEGNRYYWNIEYYSPESQYLKGYLKMLNLLLDL